MTDDRASAEAGRTAAPEAARPAAEAPQDPGRCLACGAEAGLRGGLCPACWYAAPERPKPVRARFAKLQRLRELGFEPYAYAFEGAVPLRTALDRYPGEGEGPDIRVAGRILSFRDMGGSAFAHLGDVSGRLQVYLRRDELDPPVRELVDLLDLGDWIGVEGRLFRTRTGEVTVRASDVELLAKTLRPLPLGKEEVTAEGERVVHGGIADMETRYRQRYADLAANPEVREVFRVRARVITHLRSALDARGFLEVETPVLQPMYGGAAARPFTTHHRSLDRTLFLRIADELYLKRLIVGGLDRVYEIAKNFRNEGIDRTHNPEFTMLELYQAYADYEDMMELAEELVTGAARAATGRLRLEYGGRDIDLSIPWRRISFYEAISEATGFDARGASLEDLREHARALDTSAEDAEGDGARAEDAGGDIGESERGRLLDAIFSAAVEPTLQDPTIVFDYPIELSPLAKPRRGDPALAERFEVIAGGSELANAFSELNDPIDQWERFAGQAGRRARAEAAADGPGRHDPPPAPQIDEDYIRALEYGMPPTGGIGIGIDRLVMLLTDRASIREVVLYPILREAEATS